MMRLKKLVPKVSASNFLPRLKGQNNVCTFTWCWSIHLITDEVSERKLKRSHLDSLCKQNFAQQKGKLSETLCILGFETQNASQQLSLKQHCPNVVGLRVNFSSAPHWAVQGTLQFYKDYKLNSWWPVLVLQFCWQCCPCWFLFFFDNIRIISAYFSESMSIRDGEGRAELGIGGCCCGLWAQKGGPAIGWTTSLQKCANFCESFIACALIFNAM